MLEFLTSNFVSTSNKIYKMWKTPLKLPDSESGLVIHRLQFNNEPANLSVEHQNITGTSRVHSNRGIYLKNNIILTDCGFDMNNRAPIFSDKY